MSEWIHSAIQRWLQEQLGQDIEITFTDAPILHSSPNRTDAMVLHSGSEFAISVSTDFLIHLVQQLAGTTSTYKIVGKQISSIERDVAGRMLSLIAGLLNDLPVDALPGTIIEIARFPGRIEVLPPNSLMYADIAVSGGQLYEAVSASAETEEMSALKRAELLRRNLELIPDTVILDTLSNETPPVIAVLLTHMPRARKRRLLNALPGDLPSAVEPLLEDNNPPRPSWMLLQAILAETMPGGAAIEIAM